MSRASRPEVRNPLLALPAVQRLRTLDAASQAALQAVLTELRQDANTRAEHCWQTHKAPMAAYWKAVAVYAGHLARALRRQDGA